MSETSTLEQRLGLLMQEDNMENSSTFDKAVELAKSLKSDSTFKIGKGQDGERKGRTALRNQAEWEEFSGFINDMGLVDIPCKGKKFSWFSSDGRSKSRIGRILVSNNIVNWWGVVGQQIGDMDISDHCPIWLVANKNDWGPKPFKFNNEWFQNKDFIGFLEKEWKEMEVYGRGDYVLKEKFRLLKSKLKWWNVNIFGKIDMELEEGVKEINVIDDLPSDEEEEGGARRKANNIFWMNLKIRENMLIQKARLKWINDGDDNNKYFHSIMKRGLRCNFLGPFLTPSGMISEVEEVREVVFEHFEAKFKESDRLRPFLEGDIFKTLSEEYKNNLELPFKEEEIKEAIWSCDGYKSLGPDGYSILFFKKCWEFVKKDVILCFKDFQTRIVFSKSITSCFLALIPKSNNPIGLDNYRPICLIGSIHKIISKTLAVRIKKETIIGRVLMANEMVDYSIKEKKGCLLFKVDFEKAYDKANWEFLRSMMIRMGFGEVWISWMQALVFTSHMSVMVNGSPTKEFKVERGLRQGDPISPFLFVIVAEGLKGLVNKAVENGDFAPKKIIKDIIKIQSNFLWGGVEDKRNIHWASWDTVCLPIEKGGLGVRRIGDFNVALLCKWKWRILEQTRALWYGVLKARYGDINLSFVHEGVKGKGEVLKSVWWRDILSLNAIKPLGFFNSNCKVAVGSSSITSFWHSNWTRQRVLKEFFPSLYNVSFLQQVSVALMGGWKDGTWAVNSQQLSRLQHAEIIFPIAGTSQQPAANHSHSEQNAVRARSEALSWLKQELCKVFLDSNRPDCVQWTSSMDRRFSVKSCYNVLNSEHCLCGPIGEFDKALSRVWKMDVPTKIKAFGWRCFIDRLPTRGALSHRGILPYSNTSCVFCCLCEESDGHTLLLCHNVNLVWREIAEWIGFDNYKAEGFKESFMKWYKFGKKAKVHKSK
ncbi:uncharacterized protein LOC131597549 [Vicia villosa]|uniref:uncharacterized protein LOC131597549 n=1 Tax=Vicia villosa TaxID=3911 RepID=UPI00273C1559|nr:uncharacterized protein LOC131597549 [Vicia villosa]